MTGVDLIRGRAGSERAAYASGSPARSRWSSPIRAGGHRPVPSCGRMAVSAPGMAETGGGRRASRDSRTAVSL